MKPLKHSQTVIAWLPIRGTGFDGDSHQDVAKTCIQSFLNSLPSVLPLLVPEVSNVKVLDETPSKTILSHLSRNSTLVTSRLFEIHGISATVAFQDSEDSSDTEADRSHLHAFAGHYLEKAFALALHLSELAYPGTIFTSEGLVCDETSFLASIDRKYFTSSLRPSDLTPDEWPPVKMLDLLRVTAWAKEIGFGESSFAVDRLQRTLAAFTHVVGLGWGKDGEVLFRSMQGLEAFYCEGVGDLRRQISQKSQLWLGPSPHRENIVGQLYDLRSKFIHGAAKMQYWHGIRDPWEEDKKTMERFSDGIEFATRILLSTLQKCIDDAVTEVSWNYGYSIHKIKNANLERPA